MWHLDQLLLYMTTLLLQKFFCTKGNNHNKDEMAFDLIRRLDKSYFDPHRGDDDHDPKFVSTYGHSHYIVCLFILYSRSMGFVIQRSRDIYSQTSFIKFHVLIRTFGRYIRVYVHSLDNAPTNKLSLAVTWETEMGLNNTIAVKFECL